LNNPEPVSQYFIQCRAVDADEGRDLMESYGGMLGPYLDVLSHSFFRSVPFLFALLWGIEGCRKGDLAIVTLVLGVFGLPLLWSSFVCHLHSDKSFDLMMHKGSAQKMLNEYSTQSIFGS